MRWYDRVKADGGKNKAGRKVKMLKRILVISLALVAVFSFTACDGGEELPPADEIIDGVIEAMGDVRTQEFDIDIALDMAGEAEDEAFEMTLGMAMSGAVDVVNKQMRMEMTMNMAVPGEEEMDMGVEMYLLDDEVYMTMEFPGMDSTWTKSELTEEQWEDMMEVINLAESQLEMLDVANVRITGTEEIKGVDCYVLQLMPDMEQLWNLAQEQMQLPGQELPGFGEFLDKDVIEERLQEVFSSFSVKQWVAKDTYFLMKAEVDMDMELNPEAFGYPEEEGEMAMGIAMNLLAYNYNQPISIVLPPEAEEAIEETGW
jgi:hypothetical protein